MMTGHVVQDQDNVEDGINVEQGPAGAEASAVYTDAEVMGDQTGLQYPTSERGGDYSAEDDDSPYEEHSE